MNPAIAAAAIVAGATHQRREEERRKKLKLLEDTRKEMEKERHEHQLNQIINNIRKI